MHLLDANVFIQAKNRHYGFDFCPAFWDWLDDANRRGIVYSIEKVAYELIAGNDELAEWAEQRMQQFFLSPDSRVLPAFARVSNWVNSQNYEQAAIHTFLNSADFYLVAQALAYQFIIVTHEVKSNSHRIVKIPNVCIGLGIKYITPFEMLRQQKARFVLKQ